MILWKVPFALGCFLSVVSLTGSCTKPEGFRTGTIQVRVTGVDTKSAVTTTRLLNESGAFSMAAYLSDDYVKRNENGVITDTFEGGEYFSGSGNVTLTGGVWNIAGEPEWVEDVDTHFWAWHPVSSYGRSITGPVVSTPGTGPDDPEYPYTGALRFSYVTPTPDGTTDAASAEDLLFAYATKKYEFKEDPTYNDLSIDITFHHALSQVRFCVSTDDGTFDKSLKIKNITITNLKTSGDAVFEDDEFEWSNQAGEDDFGQDYDADFSTSTVTGWTKGSYTRSSHTYNLYTCENVFFVIPQTIRTVGDYPSSNQLTVVFDYKGNETSKSVPLAGLAMGDSDDWDADYYYTYKIDATTVGRDIDLSVSLVGWSNRKEEIFVI